MFTPHRMHLTHIAHSVVSVPVCVLRTAVSSAKTDEPIEMPFGAPGTPY